jgi:hypothetical protein
VKTTPVTAPVGAVPTARIPDADNVIPVGKGWPLGEIPKVPPCRTPLGSVAARLTVDPLPAMK